MSGFARMTSIFNRSTDGNDVPNSKMILNFLQMRLDSQNRPTYAEHT